MKITEIIESILIELGFFSWVVLHSANTCTGDEVTFMGKVQMTRQQATQVARAVGAPKIAKIHGPFKRIIEVKRRVRCQY